MNHTSRRAARVSAAFARFHVAAALVACGATSAACGPSFDGSDPGLPTPVVVDGSVPSPAPDGGADGASLPPDGAPLPLPDAARPDAASLDGATTSDGASADAAPADAASDGDSAAPEDAAPPPVDAAEAGPVVCGPGTADCDGDPGVDCETNIGTDPKHCGSCGHDCTGLPHVSGATTCGAGGACVVPASSCQAGFAHCSANPDQGCETDLSQPGTCGSCSTVCSGATPVCSPNGSGGFACSSGCPSSAPTRCGNTCVDTTKDPGHCGGCATDCNATAPPDSTAGCSMSMCTFSCDATYHACGAACDSNTSTASCGTSCTPCSPPPDSVATCDGTSCGFTCDAQYHQCGAACDSNTSTQSCGSSCTPCAAPADSTATCDGTRCGFTCDAGFHGCPSAAPTGCDSNTSVSSCGTSCTPCTPPANSTATCDGTSCGFTCNAGYTQCGAACVNQRTDPQNCGACGHSCSFANVMGTCVAAECQPAILAGGLPDALAMPLVIDATKAYFADGAIVYSIPKTGGAPAAIGTAASGLTITALVQDTSNLYFAASVPAGTSGVGGIYSIPKTGGAAPQPVYQSAVPEPYGLAIAGSVLYFTMGSKGAQVHSINTDGSNLQMAMNPNLGAYHFTESLGIAADASGAVFTAGSLVRSFVAPGVVQTATNAWAVDLDASHIYWADVGAGAVYQMNRDGSGVMALASAAPSNPTMALTTDGAFVYWATANGDHGTVHRVPIGGGADVTLSPDEASPWSIAVDAAAVYWTDMSSGRLMILAK